MKSLLYFAAIGIVALPTMGYAQDSKKPPVKAEVTQAMYMVSELH